MNYAVRFTIFALVLNVVVLFSVISVLMLGLSPPIKFWGRLQKGTKY